MTIAACLLAAGIGVVLGLLGGGGTLLTVPVFVYVLHVQPKTAIAMSLPVVGVTSLLGAWGHWRRGHVDVGRAVLFGTFAMAGSYLGAKAAVLVSAQWQLTLLSLMMVAAGTAMLRHTSSRVAGVSNTDPLHENRARGFVAPTGFLIGSLTGLVGIGGGFLFVPALVLLAEIPVKDAVGTSLLVIAMSSAAGVLGYAGEVAIPWRVVALFIASASAGILAGVWLMRFIPSWPLQRGFAILLLVVASLMLFENPAASCCGIGTIPFSAINH